MLAVFENVRNFGIAISILTGFSETDFYIVVAISVHPHGGQTERIFQFACGTGIIFGTGADNRSEIAFDFRQDNLAACFENLFGYFIRPFTER